MQNEFEKQVQKKMEELKFVPTEPVWEKIEEQIRKKRDRRKLVLWLPLLFLFLAGGIWWMNGVNEKKNPVRLEEKQTSSVPQKKNEIDKKNEIRKEKSSTQNTQNNYPEKITGNTTLRLPNFTTPEKTGKKNESFVTNDQVTETRAGIINISTQKPELIFNQKSETDLLRPYGSSVVIKYKLDIVRNNIDKMEENPLAKNEEIKADSSLTGVATINELPKKMSNPKWKVGLSVNTGFSGLGKGINFSGGQKSLSDASQSPSQGPSPPAYNFRAASPVNNSLTFSLGLLAKKQVGKRSFLSTGLEYRYYSTRIEVGTKISQDTVLRAGLSVNSFYTNPGTVYNNYNNNYHNRFHFISLPLGFDFRLLKKRPLYFHAGLSLQQLVKTNALQYSYPSQIYYHDKEAYKKTQFFSELGFHYSIPVKKMSLLFGPELQYGLSRLEKDNPGYHLFSFGLKAQLLFSKK